MKGSFRNAPLSVKNSGSLVSKDTFIRRGSFATQEQKDSLLYEIMSSGKDSKKMRHMQPAHPLNLAYNRATEKPESKEKLATPSKLSQQLNIQS